MKMWDEAMGVTSDEGPTRFATPDGYVGPKACDARSHAGPGPLHVGDIVCVVRQPRNQFASIEGERGFIEEIKGEYANIQTLHLDGTTAGCGSVPLNCLKLDLDPRWHQAKLKHEMRLSQYLEQMQAWSKRWENEVARVAKLYGVSDDVALKIYQDLDRWQDQQRP